VVLGVLAALTPMYFDRWYRGMIVVGVATAIATALADVAAARPTLARGRLPVRWLAFALPAVTYLHGAEATVVHGAWSAIVVLASSRGTRWPRVLAVNVVLGASLFSIYEYAVREIDKGRRPPGAWNVAELISQPYYIAWNERSDAISRARLSTDRESAIASTGITREGDLLTLADYPGRFITVRDGRRVTVGVPPRAGGRVLVFGGSTIFCAEVPNDLTVPSLLQAELRERGKSYEVLNFGVPGARAVHQLARLRTVQLRPTDVVVFYDGGNDAWQIYEQIRDEHAAATPRRQIRRALELVERRSRVLFNAFLSDRLMYIDRDSIVRRSRDRVTEAWSTPVEEARREVESAGARFLHVLQPHLFTYARSSARGPMGEDIAAVYRALQSAVVGTEDVDATGVFDASTTSPYLDWVHLEDDGNRVIAATLADVIVSVRS
jgi:lysophospholipase L1-like esterase